MTNITNEKRKEWLARLCASIATDNIRYRHKLQSSTEFQGDKLSKQQREVIERKININLTFIQVSAKLQQPGNEAELSLLGQTEKELERKSMEYAFNLKRKEWVQNLVQTLEKENASLVEDLKAPRTSTRQKWKLNNQIRHNNECLTFIAHLDLNNQNNHSFLQSLGKTEETCHNIIQKKAAIHANGSESKLVSILLKPLQKIIKKN